MSQLAESDVRRLLRLVADLRETTWETKTLLAELHAIVPSDRIVFSRLDIARRRVLGWDSHPDGGLSPEREQAMWRFGNQLPPCDPRARPDIVSDRFTRRALHRLDFYDAFLRPVQAEYLLRVPLPEPPDRSTSLLFARSTRDFSERDRTVVALLRPYLAESRRPPPHGLTPREMDVLRAVARGLTNDEVAAALDISAGTVRKHLENAFRKLGVHTRTAAVARAFGSS